MNKCFIPFFSLSENNVFYHKTRVILLSDRKQTEKNIGF